MAAFKIPALVRLALIALLTLSLAVFHGFVGWHKTFSSHAELARETAWTMHLPETLGKAVGLLEMGLAAILLASLLRPHLARLGMIACLALLVLEAIALFSHQTMGDGAPAFQNVLTILVTALLGWLYAQRASTIR